METRRPGPAGGAALPPPSVRRRTAWLESSVAIWLLRLLTVVVIAAVVSTAHARIDRGEVAIPTYALASGHPSAAYPPIPPSLRQRISYQPPGFPVVAAIPVAVWRGLTGGANPSGALTLAGYGAAALVVIAGGRLVGRGPGGRRRETLFLLAMALSPFFRESLGNYFHPEDVLALGLLLLALSLASDRRWLWAGTALGLAFGCKQWVLLAAPLLLVWAPSRQARVRLVGATACAAAVVYAPLLVLTPRAAGEVLRGPIPVAGGFVPQTTILGMLRKAPFHVPVSDVNDLARLLPVVFAVAVAALWGFVISRRAGTVARLAVEDVLGLVLAVVAFRLIGDCIALSYYALPLSVLIAVVAARRSKIPAVAIVSSFALAFWYGSGWPGDLLDPWTGAVVFTIAVVAVAATAVWALRGRPEPASTFDGRVLADPDRGAR